jgi:hypothetical protein
MGLTKKEKKVIQTQKSTLAQIWKEVQILKDGLDKNRKNDKQKLMEIGSLLCSWEDDNITDYQFCNKVGKILGLGNWTWKGKKEKRGR